MKTTKRERKSRGPYKKYWSKDGPSGVPRSTIISRTPHNGAGSHSKSDLDALLSERSDSLNLIEAAVGLKALFDSCTVDAEPALDISNGPFHEAACVGSMHTTSIDAEPAAAICNGPLGAAACVGSMYSAEGSVGEALNSYFVRPCLDNTGLHIQSEEAPFVENQPFSPGEDCAPEQECSNGVSEHQEAVSLDESFNDEFCHDFNVDEECFSEEEACRDLVETPVVGEAGLEIDAPPLHQTQTADPDPEPSDSSDSDEEMAVAPQLHLTIQEKIKILLLLATKRRHKLSYAAAEDIMELSGVMSQDCENAFLPSKHIMKRAIELYSFELSEHHVCPACGFYIGVVPGTSFHCERCDEQFETLKNRQEGNIFLVLPLEDQLRAILENCVSEEEIINVQEREKINKYNYEDLFDGAHYKDNFLPEFLTFNFFIDGLQIGTTTKTSATPVLVSLNELPLHLRRKYLMMASVWLGKKKPNCNEYLKPFVTQCTKLQTSGVRYRRNGVTRIQKVKACTCISDSIARPPLRNCAQFNGKYGCGLCYHPGIRLPFGRGHVRSYSTQNRSFPLRTHEETVEYARQAERINARVKGVKGHAILSEIPGFDIITQLDPDSFHCLVNVSKRFAWLWFGERFSGKPFNINQHFSEVDARLMRITPTSDISRLRSLTERSDYRGHEWYYWILMFSIPCLKNILPNKYLNHWSLLPCALAMLMQNSVAKSELAYAERFLNLFVSQIDSLYGAAHVTFSIHILTHLAQSVANFGQPWAHSALFYEAENAEIKEEVHSHNGAIFQISKGMQLKVALKKLEYDIQHEMSDMEKQYLKKMSSSQVAAKPHLTIGNFGFLGKPQMTVLNIDVSSALRRSAVVFDEAVPHATYFRCVIDREEFHSTQYARTTKQNNCVALLNNGSVFIIESFVVISPDRCFALGHYAIEKKNFKICDPVPPHLKVLKMQCESTLRCIHMSLIQAKLVSFIVKISDTESIRLAYTNVLSLEMLR